MKVGGGNEFKKCVNMVL